MGFLSEDKGAKLARLDREASAQKWEYKARNLQKVFGASLENDFNQMGRVGWEFVAMASGGKEGYAIFKRPL